MTGAVAAGAAAVDGATLRKRRQAADVPKAQVAAALGGMHSSTLQAIEEGHLPVTPEIVAAYEQAVTTERIRLLPMQWVTLPGTDWQALLCGRPGKAGDNSETAYRTHARPELGGWDLSPWFGHCLVRKAYR